MVYSGCNVTIKVIVKNEGIFVETINVTVYYEDNVIEKQSVNLSPAAYRILTFFWDTTGVPYGNYTITATARPLPSETYTTDNTHPNGWVIVTGKGDVNGDRVVNALDRIKVAISFGPS